MARALLLALTCAAAASAARYVDYGGDKMPAYGAGDYDPPRDSGAGAAPSYDYRGHSPDVPASPDYKFEEAPRVKTETPAKDTDETEVWRKPGRKQRGLGRPPIESVTEGNVHARDEQLAPRARGRYGKHRSRLKSEHGEPALVHPVHTARRPNKYSQDRKDDVSDIDTKDYFHVDKDDFPDDKSKEFDEDVKFVNEATTRRARRKPRDRFVKRKSSDLDMDMLYDEEDLDPRVKVGESERARPTELPMPVAVRTHPQHPRFRASEDEDERGRDQEPRARRPRPYDDYDDYYDMKRVQSINSKLPSLHRRTTEWASPPTPTSYLDLLWTHRRVMPDEDAPSPSTSTERVPSPRPRTPTTTSATRRTRTTTPPTTTISTTTANATALSLAEKSRLSILKKDQRKKGQHMDAPTLKPAVLLQVTQMLPTVVMVEPPSSAHPWLRMRDLSEDSPEHIEKVKKFMRHRLVGEAKSIQDLTSNWDEMVCDYVDVAMLDAEDRSRAAVLRPPYAPLSTLCLVILVSVCLK